MYEDKKIHHVLVHGIGHWVAIRLHHLVKNVVQQHRCISPDGGGSGGWGNLERIADVGIKRVVQGMVNVACCVIAVLLAGEGGSDFSDCSHV